MLPKLSSNISLKLLSLVIATVLWFAVLGSRNVEITKEVPIEIVTPSELTIANEIPDKVSFRLSGPKAFLRNILNRKEEPIRINFSTAKPGLLNYRFFQDNIQVPLGVKVLAMSPAAIVVKLESVRKKDVPLRLALRGEAPPGFKITRVELTKPNIRIKGPESRIDVVNELFTSAVDLSTLHESGEKEIGVDLSHYPGIGIDGDLPHYQFEVLQSTATFKIRNIEVKVLTSRPYQVIPKEVSILVRCSPEEMKQIDRTKFYAYADLKNKRAGEYDEVLSVQLPSSIKLIKVLPSKVKISLR